MTVEFARTQQRLATEQYKRDKGTLTEIWWADWFTEEYILQHEPITFGSLFTGIGGMDLGLERAGLRCKWQVEVDEFCRKVLTKHWPNVPKYGDIKEVSGDELERVDILAGGFPCQDVSNAGKRRGIGGERSGLWSEFARLIRALRPRVVIVENVPGLLVRGMGNVLGDLAACGYDAQWDCVPACAVGAEHIRERVFIIAYPKRAGLEGQGIQNIFASDPPGEDFQVRRLSEPDVVRKRNGIPNYVDRIKGLGNAVDPRVAQWVGRRVREAFYAR